MPEPHSPDALGILEVGPIARRALHEGARGEIRAVFERSFYVELGSEWVCFGPRTLGAGPLNALHECRPGATWRDGEIAVGDPVTIGHDVIRIGAAVRFRLADPIEWMPPAPGAWDAVTLASGLESFDGMVADIMPHDSLAVLASRTERCGPLSIVARTAAGPADDLAGLVRADVLSRRKGSRIVPRSLGSLLGLGPGLTPSGDDFLGGAMVALSSLGLTGLRDAIWETLEPLVADRTNDISRAHLTAAARGLGSAALHAVLNAVIGGRTDNLGVGLAAIDAIGHTSGWDALAGAVTVMRAWLDTQPVRTMSLVSY